MEEIWIVFVYKGIETKYFGSSLGNVGRMWNGKMKILKQFTTKKGYKQVALMINGERINFSVHRIIATCFLDNPNNYKEVNHINGKEKFNNRPSNLEWCDHQYNMTAAKEHELLAKGEKNGQAKITEAIVIEIFRLYNVEGWTQQRIADHFGISNRQVSYILNRKCWGWLPIDEKYLKKEIHENASYDNINRRSYNQERTASI